MCFSKSWQHYSLIIIVTLLCSTAAHADTLDQVNAPGAIDFTANSVNDVGQSFTVGLSGQLTQVDLFIGRDASTSTDLEFDIRDMSGSLPSESDVGGNIHASLTRSAGLISETPGWQSFDISGAGVMVSSGDTLAIVLRNSDLSGYQWYGTGGDPYANGSTFFRVGAGTWDESPFSKDTDLSFQTFVAVPEPSSFVILSAFAGLACVRRKRR